MANDHYVPQFYLRNFEIPNRRRWIFEYRKGQPPRPRAIRAVASIDNYYSLNGALADNERRSIDRLFQQLETGTAHIINHLLTADNTHLHPDDREILSMFVSFLAFRTPHARSRVMRMDAQGRAQILRILAGYQEFFVQQAQRIGIDADEAEAARQAVLDLGDDLQIEYGEGADDYFTGAAFEMADFVVPLVNEKYWNLLECSDGGFVTSDNPVTLVRPKDVPPQLSIGFEQATIILPISPRRCLILSNSPVPREFMRDALLQLLFHPFQVLVHKRKVISISRDEATAINRSIISQAHEGVFAHLLSDEIQQTFN